MILPSVLLSEDVEILSNQDSTAFARRIQHVLDDSKEMQKKLEANIRKAMKKHGEERRFVAITPPDEVVKGYPDTELKWMFGKKEVVIPKAASHHLLHGWKKWREDAKMDLKKSLMEDPELGKKYVAQRQVRPNMLVLSQCTYYVLFKESCRIIFCLITYPFLAATGYY